VDDEPVRADLAARLLSGEGPVAGADALPPADRVGEGEERVAGHRLSRRRPRREAEGRLERLHPAAERVRQHAVDLLQRAVHGRRRALEPEPARRDQPEHDHDRLLVVEHQRRQPVARPQPVAASDAALALDRDAELLQGGHVAAHRAPVDAEPVGDLATRRERPALQQLEQLEESRRGGEHVVKSSRDSGHEQPYFVASLPGSVASGRRSFDGAAGQRRGDGG
jgi:hypothetical protein